MSSFSFQVYSGSSLWGGENFNVTFCKNENISVMYFYLKWTALHIFFIFLVSNLQNQILLPKATVIFGNAWCIFWGLGPPNSLWGPKLKKFGNLCGRGWKNGSPLSCAHEWHGTRSQLGFGATVCVVEWVSSEKRGGCWLGPEGLSKAAHTHRHAHTHGAVTWSR